MHHKTGSCNYSELILHVFILYGSLVTFVINGVHVRGGVQKKGVLMRETNGTTITISNIILGGLIKNGNEEHTGTFQVRRFSTSCKMMGLSLQYTVHFQENVIV